MLLHLAINCDIIDGADVNLEDINGWNCVHVAAYHGDLNLESIIKSCRNVDAQVFLISIRENLFSLNFLKLHFDF